MDVSKLIAMGLLLSTAAFSSCSQADPEMYPEVPAIPETPDTPSTPDTPEPEFVIPEVHPIALSGGEATVINRYNTFAWRFIKEIQSESGAGNTSVSPLSASIALSMLANGANGETYDEIMKVLGFEPAQLNDMNSCNRKLVDQLGTVDNTVDFTSVGSLWQAPDLKVLPSYSTLLADCYDTEFHNITGSFIDDVNSWCNDKTKGLITRILNDDADFENLRLMLMNAIYFKGCWSAEYIFDKTETAEAVFHGVSGDSNTDFMRHKGSYGYFCGNGMKAASIPFGSSHFSFTVILPDQGVAPASCIEDLANGVWKEIMDSRSKETLDVKLPKFSAGDNFRIVEALKAMGIVKAFDNVYADFSNMAGENIYVGSASQAVRFRIDENGAEGAAVTYIGEFTESAEEHPEPEYKPFVADRPFYYVVSEVSSGAILFMGLVNQL